MAKYEYTCDEDTSCGINIPKELDNLTELEQKHIPVISTPEQVKRNQSFELTVEVGKLREHPNEPAHFIEWIEVYSGDTFLFRTTLAGSLSKAKVTVSVKLTHAHGPLKAWAKCNIHGPWEGEKDIEVEE